MAACEKDPYDLKRFIDAQNHLAGPDVCMFDQACRELREGQKRSHWMWFIFPQLRGLGWSAMSNRYGISGLREAEAYSKHPVLGPRLCECTRLVLGISHCSVEEIFGEPDDAKFRSSMTLFGQTLGDNRLFHEALQKYFNGKPDTRTLELL